MARNDSYVSLALNFKLTFAKSAQMKPCYP